MKIEKGKGKRINDNKEYMKKEIEKAKSGHTPGPWTVEVCRAGQSSITGVKYADSIIQPLNILAERHAAGEVSANAALIAAAPDLLAALENVLSAVAYSEEAAADILDLGEIRAAIAKAKGV